MKIQIILNFFVLNVVHSNTWIDPHDMNTNHKFKIKKTISTFSGSNNNEASFCKDCSCDNQNTEDVQYLFYLKRLVNLLVGHTSFAKSDTVHSGHVLINLKSDDYRYLKEFVQKQDIDLKSLRKLDGILSEGIQRDILNDYLENFETISYTIFSSRTLAILGIAFMLYVVYDLCKHNFSIWYIMKYLILVILILDYGFRYSILLEEAEEHNLNVQLTSNCDPGKMTWVQYFGSMWKEQKEQCNKITVTPLSVFLYQIERLIIVPMRSFGTGFGGFGKELFYAIPFPWNIIVGPLMLVFACFLIISFISLLLGTSIKLNILHMINFEFGRNSNQTQEERITGNTLARILDSLSGHRIEDVSQVRETRQDRRRRTKKEQTNKIIISPEIQDQSPASEVKDSKVEITETVANRTFKEEPLEKIQCTLKNDDTKLEKKTRHRKLKS